MIDEIDKLRALLRVKELELGELYKKDKMSMNRMTPKMAEQLVKEFNRAHMRGEYRKTDSLMKTRNGYWDLRGFLVQDLGRRSQKEIVE